MRNKKVAILIFLCAVIAQVLLLYMTVTFKERSIRSGTKIIVKTIPVDPRSIFRGDYIRLRYEFSQIDLRKIKNDNADFYRGRVIFVKLIRLGAEWRVAQVSGKLIPVQGSDEVVLRGIVDEARPGNFVNVSYGIESYFVPEGRGAYIERHVSRKSVTVQLSVDRSGSVSVYKIFIDGKEVSFT
ncbi:MAG: GDYXXLXY domain-containing protein [Candidatus Omnitrophota bacterium]|nr:GDYXXLXY domain-containing protein [Candidatus Omnitrophota bacterium]